MLSQQLKKLIKKMQDKKYRYEERLFVVEGKKGVEEAVRVMRVRAVVVDEKRTHEFEFLLAEARQKQIQIEFCTAKDGTAISSTETFPGLLAVVEMNLSNLSSFEFDKPIVCLDRINDPGNLGTIIRTADWFGIKNILLSVDCVDPYNEKTVRSTMGSLFHVNIVQSNSILQDIEKIEGKGYSVVTLALGGKPISYLKKNPKSLYVFGSESHGVRSEILRKSKAYTIPGFGKAESLNVGVAVGIVLFSIKE